MKVLLHALFWLVIYSLPFLLRSQYDSSRKVPSADDGFLYFYIVSSIAWVIFFYANAYVFLPAFIQKKKFSFYILYVLSVACVVIAIYFLHKVTFTAFVKSFPFVPVNFFIFNISPFLFILASSTAYRVVLDKMSADKRMQEKENERLKTELLFLRSQVSPHFMFNVLNNMVALARKKSDLLEPSLIKLSSLMRYMLYETGDAKVPLEKEIEYLQSYIDLQQQRFGKNVTVNTCLKEIENGCEIEPMLLIPFVENAFKHGTGLITDAQIDVKLRTSRHLLNFEVRNKYNGITEEIKDKTSGIGLNNAERRLNLLYGKKHSLHIEKTNNWFTVSLQIQLN